MPRQDQNKWFKSTFGTFGYRHLCNHCQTPVAVPRSYNTFFEEFEAIMRDRSVSVKTYVGTQVLAKMSEAPILATTKADQCVGGLLAAYSTGQGLIINIFCSRMCFQAAIFEGNQIQAAADKIKYRGAVALAKLDLVMGEFTTILNVARRYGHVVTHSQLLPAQFSQSCPASPLTVPTDNPYPSTGITISGPSSTDAGEEDEQTALLRRQRSQFGMPTITERSFGAMDCGAVTGFSRVPNLASFVAVTSLMSLIGLMVFERFGSDILGFCPPTPNTTITPPPPPVPPAACNIASFSNMSALSIDCPEPALVAEGLQQLLLNSTCTATATVGDLLMAVSMHYPDLSSNFCSSLLEMMNCNWGAEVNAMTSQFVAYPASVLVSNLIAALRRVARR